MNEQEQDDELRAMAPQLHRLRQQQRSSSQEVPKTYFQTFETRLQQRLATERALEPHAAPSTSRGTRWRLFWRPALLALVPAMAVILWWNGRAPAAPVETVPTFAELSYVEMGEYLEQNPEDISTQALLAVLDEDALLVEESVVEEELVPESTTTDAESTKSLDRALETTGAADLLEELTPEELEDDDWL